MYFYIRFIVYIPRHLFIYLIINKFLFELYEKYKININLIILETFNKVLLTFFLFM